MKQTGDLNLVKKINKSIVLEHLREHSPISRADIAKRTGLTKATVSSLTRELIGSSLVYEIGAGQSSGGRKPTLLMFNGSAGYAVGVDLGVNYMFATLTDLNGRIAYESRLDHENDSSEVVVHILKSCIMDVISHAPASPYGIVGIGIGIPGISDDQGNVVFAPNLGWGNIPLQQQLEDDFQLPVVIDNEANAGAVGEKQYGAGKEASHMMYVSIGIGIGAGMIMKGELYRGSSGFFGEVGHVSIQQDGTVCRCGNSGCWELYASENALLEAARMLGFGQKINVVQLLQHADEGNEQAVKLFEQVGRLIGVGVVNIINGFNPELILLGGRLAAAEKWLKQPMMEEVTKRALPYPRSRLSVQFSGLGGRSTVLGACSFVISKFFASTKVSFE